MKFRNYCIVIMGNTEGCKLEIGKIAEGSPRFLDAKGITISTFTSVAEPPEITDFFKSLDRNFMVFDTDTSSSGFNLTNKKLNDALFGHITNEFDVELEEMSNRLIDDIRGDVKPSSGSTKHYEKENNSNTLGEVKKKQVKQMNRKERELLLNDILDKGYDNLSSLDKEILEILTKK